MIGILADVHCANHKRFGGPVQAGINRRCRQVLDALEVEVQRCKDRGCKGLAVLGDLFDTVNPPQQVVTEVQRILGSFGGMGVWVLLGNHEQVSDQLGDHALGPLAPVVKVVERPTWVMPWRDYQVLFVPFQPGHASEWLPAVLDEVTDGRHHNGIPTAMVLHLGLADDDTPAFLRGAHDAVTVTLVRELCAKHKIDACFAGNWHHHKVLSNSPLIAQVGTLAPTGFDNLGLDHGQIVYWDGQAMAVEQVPGPRFLKVRAEEDVDLEAASGCQVYVQIIADHEHIVAARAELGEALDEGLVCAGEVVPDSKEVRAAAKKAAMVARSADTLDEALAAYVGDMPLEDDVDRAAVLERSRSYLGGAE